MKEQIKKIVWAIAERAIKTFFYTLAAVIGAQNLTKATEVDWASGLDVALLATFFSVAGSIISLKFGNQGPSLADETITPAEIGKD